MGVENSDSDRVKLNKMNENRLKIRIMSCQGSKI